METVTLAQQFHDIQLRQTERYKTRVAKLHSKSAQQQPFDSAADMPSDDLGLMTETQKREKGVVVPSHARGAENDTSVGDEMVKNLRHQVEQLQSEKAHLSSQLKAAEKKVSTFQKTLEEERDALGNGIATTQKVVELSKKNRILHAELTVERNRNRQMEKQIKEALPVQQVYVQEVRVEGNSTETGQNLQLQLTALQEQLAQCKNKITDYRNQCQLLKQDLKLAHRVIAKEVGPGMTVSALLNSPSGWRGRSQQIITLQNKLFEMKGLLEKTSSKNKTADAKSEHACSSREGGRRVDTRQKTVLVKMEQERKQNLETTRKELERMQTESAQAHRECRALRARNKTLTEEMKLLKSEGPSLKRNSAMQNGNAHTNTHALELRIHKLEGANQLLKQQLQESKCLRPSTRTEALSLHSLHKPPSSQARAKSYPIRETLTAHQQTAEGEKYTLREAQVLAQMAEHERDKLLDLTLTLQQRLDNTTDQLMRLKLEKSIGQKLPKFGLSGAKHGMKQRPRLDGQIEALEAEIAIQRDENAVLKETLSQLRQEKLEDMRTFHDTLQDTRKMCVGRHNTHYQ